MRYLLFVLVLVIAACASVPQEFDLLEENFSTSNRSELA